MYLHDLFSYSQYMEMMNLGYIRETFHPSLDLRIINYTEKAQFDNEWNAVTTQCRGLIVNSGNTVIARPFDKFLNYGQNAMDFALANERVIATDKMDGSLGILWNYKGFIGIATRGSFTSDQAVHANAVLEKYWLEPWFRLDYSNTYLFEIVYPDNRIVLDYGDMDDLVLLGARNINSGAVRLPNDIPEWQGPKTQTFSYKTLREALGAPQRPNAEGLVLYFPDLDYRIKLKQDDYVALHKIVTGLTERRVWENMTEGKTLVDLCEVIPDEWHDWLKETYKKIYREFLVLKTTVISDYRQVVRALDKEGEWTRKDFAHLVTSGEWGDYPGIMFSLLDGKEIESAIWKLIRPTSE